MIGEKVTVEYREKSGVDEYNADTFSTRLEEVYDVLVAPSGTSDLSDGGRPDGASAYYELHFPKSFEGDLRGCRVNVRGEWLDIVGSPMRYAPGSTPTRWNMRAEAAVVHG